MLSRIPNFTFTPNFNWDKDNVFLCINTNALPPPPPPTPGNFLLLDGTDFLLLDGTNLLLL
jgi:hypothetical protein